MNTAAKIAKHRASKEGGAFIFLVSCVYLPSQDFHPCTLLLWGRWARRQAMARPVAHVDVFRPAMNQGRSFLFLPSTM
jgi:hypothetical protein